MRGPLLYGARWLINVRCVEGIRVFGNVYRCTKCRFSFSSGWSHHEGGQLLVCKTCGKHYVLGGGQSCWGAKDGERLQLLAGNEEEQVPTGVSVAVSVTKPDPKKKW